jgi:hypothetical protein
MKTFVALCLVMLTCSLFAGSSSGPPNLQPPGYAFIKSCDVGQFAPVQVPTDHQISSLAFNTVMSPITQVEVPFAEVPTLTIQNYSYSETITALQPDNEVLKLPIPGRNCLNCQYTMLKTVFSFAGIPFNCPLPYS